MPSEEDKPEILVVPNRTVLPPEGKKLLPLIVTLLPAAPEIGLRPLVELIVEHFQKY